MNCRRADQLFSAAWEDELTLVEREALESHMAACTACRVAYDEFVRVMEAVQGLPRAEAAADFADGVWSRIRAVESSSSRRGRVLSIGWSWASFRPALAAAACLVVVGGAVAYWQAHNTSSQAPTVATPSPATMRQESLPVAAAPALPKSEIAKKHADQPTRVATRQTVEPEPAPSLDRDDAPMGEQVATSAEPSPEASMGGRVADPRMMARSLGAAKASLLKQDSSALSDTLFDHRYDVEFALDPVRLDKTGKGRLTPARPVPTEVQGKPAKVTF
ncbi:MAG TPA: zf-HC2 domain-containing protein [Candidatus Eisenbacteria bacterium]|nr:zf-HC2 domain-containing protein [Candidatus Eisenbacteria bacterium]